MNIVCSFRPCHLTQSLDSDFSQRSQITNQISAVENNIRKKTNHENIPLLSRLSLDNRSHIPVSRTIGRTFQSVAKCGGSLHCTIHTLTVGQTHYTSLNPRTSFSAIRGGNPFNISTKKLHSPKHAAVDIALPNLHCRAHFHSLNFLAFTALTFLRRTTSAPGFKAFATWAKTVAPNPGDVVTAFFGVFAAVGAFHG